MELTSNGGYREPGTNHDQKDRPALGDEISEAPTSDRLIAKAEMPGAIVPEEMEYEAPPPDASTAITYLYLTFDTPVPSPNVGEPRADNGDLPPCPDLSGYTDPLTWPKTRKGVMVAISCIATCFTAYAAGAYSESADLIAAEFNSTHEAALVGVTTFCIGFAVAPMVLAPFSEINGRYPIFAIAGVVFVVFQAVCGVVTNLAGMLIARFFKGVGGSVFSTMVGGVIADMYEKEDRNTPMALFSGSVLVGTGLGPLVAAVMVERWGSEGQKWKWVFWHQGKFHSSASLEVVRIFILSARKIVEYPYTHLHPKAARRTSTYVFSL